jgi:hypothetical protein
MSRSDDYYNPPRPPRRRTPEECEALARAFAGNLNHAPNLTELTGCEDEDDMNQEDREAMKRHDLLIDENRDRITALMSEYRADQKWLKQAITEQAKRHDKIDERLGAVERMLTNGFKERQVDISNRLAKVETVLETVVTQEDLAVHKEDEERLSQERWRGQHRRREDKYKTLAMIISMAAAVLSPLVLFLLQQLFGG